MSADESAVAEVRRLRVERADRQDEVAAAVGYTPGLEWSDLVGIVASNTTSLVQAERDVRALRARIAELERTVRQMVDGLNGHDCPPPGESPMGAVTRFAVRLMEAERLAAEDGCSCPPVDRTHQVGCPLDGVPASSPRERPVDALTAVFVPVASLREPEPEFYGLVHHDYRVSHDLPETGGACERR